LPGSAQGSTAFPLNRSPRRRTAISTTGCYRKNCRSRQPSPPARWSRPSPNYEGFRALTQRPASSRSPELVLRNKAKQAEMVRSNRHLKKFSTLRWRWGGDL